jgi:sugar/nucleoside kinase (ribokinase family)
MMSSATELLAIGHITRDMHSDGTFSLGGTVTFAALVANHLGLTVGVVTCADAELSETLPAHLPHVALHIQYSVQTTTFANLYQGGFRIQYLYTRGTPLQLIDIPQEWLVASIVLFAPVAQELDIAFVTRFPRRPGSILAATPQGWLRRWDADGRIWPALWHNAEQILPLLDVLILSHDDLLPFANGNRTEADAILLYWSKLVPLLVATDGRHGATLFEHGTIQHFSAYPAQEVDPTGAGDVFATAFLIHLFRHGNPARAVDFANCTAAFSIEQLGTQGIPTLAMVEQRLHSQPY